MRDTRGISTFGVIAIIFVGLIGLGIFLNRGTSSSHGGTALPGQHLAGAATAAGANAGELAPDFTLTSLDGQQISLSSYRGQKPVVLDFFATWCPNCRRDMPKQQALYEKYNGEIEVIAIDLNESQRTVEKYITDNNFTFPVVMDPGGRVARNYQVRFTNTHVYIDRNGVIQRTNYSDSTDSAFRALLES